MNPDLLAFLHNQTELSRLQAAEIVGIFGRAREAGWAMIAVGGLDDGEVATAISAAQEHKAAIEHNMEAYEGPAELRPPLDPVETAAPEGGDVPDDEAVH